jgi:helix-turn-helix protein
MDKRLASEISMLRSELQYAQRVSVLETKLSEIEKRLGMS